MKKIGILGGTFNPIHIGHLMLAECVKEELSLDQVWLIPTGCSYLKEEQRTPESGMPTPAQRLHMTELAAEDVPRFKCLDVEVKREGNTYTYETLEELSAQYPDAEFYFIVGADCLFSIEEWKCPERIFARCHLAAALRDKADLIAMEEKRAYLEEKFNARITLLPFRRLELSSTEIRERVKEGKSVRYMLPDKVRLYIEEKGFYKNEDN